MLQRYARLACAAMLLGSVGLVLEGCGSGGVLGFGGSSVGGNASLTPISITDAPSDQVLALGLTVNSIRLFDSNGNGVDVLTTPTKIEALHLNAVHEPLRAPLNIPQGTYSSATITVANPVVTYVDPTTKKPVTVNATLTAASTTVTFSSAITVGANSAPICFDLLVGPSVTISGSTVTVTPTFDVKQVKVNGRPTNPSNGRNDDVVGTVVSVSSNSLVVTTANGTQVTITTDSQTQFQGFTALSQLTAGQMVEIDIDNQSNGTLVADRIHLVQVPSGALLRGVVTATTGKPATSFTQVVRQAIGSAAAGITAGTSLTINVNGSTQFMLAPQSGSMPSLPFTPTFNASTILSGQNVGVATTAIASGAATATTVTLLPQTVEGIVASVTTSTGYNVYVVTLPSGSALASLAGVSSVTVYEPLNAQVTTTTALTVGSSARVNGLLFNDSGVLRMVAGLRCDMPGNPPVQRH